MQSPIEQSTSQEPIYQPPLECLASRMPPARSKKSARVYHTAYMPSDEHLRRLVSESGPEFFTSQLALASPDIVSVIPQPERISFIDKRGKKRHHTFDLLLEHSDGKKTAVAVKPFDRVINSDFRETLSVIAGQMPSSFADRVCLVTDRSFTRVQIFNAAMFVDFSKDQDPEADKRLLSISEDLIGTMTIASIVALSGHGGAMFRAVVRQLFGGMLQLVSPGRICSSSQVRLACS